jgi:nicotinamidase-related amidase
VLFTANDAFLRNYHLFVLQDCVVSLTAEANERALAQMATVLKADIRQSTALELSDRKGVLST